MTTLPQQYMDMISSGAALRDFRVALIGELDKAERRLSASPTRIADELESRLAANGMALFEADDGAIDFKSESDVDMVKGALCTNFSKEKFVFAEKMILSSSTPETSWERIRNHGRSSIEGLADLRDKAEVGEISPAELKISLKVAILRELDADRRRKLPIAETVAEDAEKRLAQVGERLYEDDDRSIEFRQVGRPDVDEEILHLAKGALASNFSREKLRYASSLQTEFRRRGYDRYQVKCERRWTAEQRGAADGVGGSGSRSSVFSANGWVLATAAAAVLAIVWLFVKAL